MDETYCKYLIKEGVSGQDIFDHPTYKFYCTKNDQEILYLLCARCKNNTTKEIIE